jgi:predicted Zn-dependent protease
MSRLNRLILLLGLCAPGSAAPLTEVPGPWAGRVAAIPEQRLDELEPATVARIRETRGRLGEMLETAGLDAAELAAGFGRLGALYGAHRLYAGAELAFGNAQALDPDGFQWPYYAAHLALEQGEAAQALTHLDRAARIDPDYPTLPLRRGEALLGLDQPTAARAAYAQAAEAAPLRAAALYGLAQIDLLERDAAAAAARLGEVLALQPAADAAQYPLGQALVQLGRRDEARAHLARRGMHRPSYPDPLIEELRSLQQGARLHYEDALRAIKRDDYAAASAAFATGLAEDPTNARARTSYARTLWIAGRRDTAQVELRRAAADGPGETLPRFLLGVLHDAADDPASAITAYREVLAIDPVHQGALSYLANLSLRRGDHAAAASYFERAIDAGATELPVFLHYWIALRQAGTGDDALRDALVAFDRRFPEPPVFRYLLARLLAVSEAPGVADRRRALEIARQLHDAAPIPPHSELLALALAAAGEFAQAVALQEGLVQLALSAGAPGHAAALERVAAGYRAGTLPDAVRPLDDPLLMPAPADPEAAMRNYPAGQPY